MKELVYDRKAKKSILLPEEWNELTAKQFVKLAALRHSYTDETYQLATALKILSNESLLQFCLMPHDVKSRAIPHCKWVLGENTITQQLLPKYKGFYAPDGHFDNLLMCEFNHTEMAYQQLVQEKEMDHLNQLVAILYREGKQNYDHQRNPDGDHRIAFSFGDISWHKKKVAKWPMAVKQAILLWYDGCRMFLVNNYPLVFPKKPGKANSGNMNEGLFNLMHAVAGDKYGNFETVENSFVHKILMALTIMIQESIDMEKRMKS